MKTMHGQCISYDTQTQDTVFSWRNTIFLLIYIPGQLSRHKPVHILVDRNKVTAYQVVEDVALMQMDGDEGLKLPSVDLREVLCGHVDELVQHLQKLLVHFPHYLFVLSSIGQCNLGIPGPNELDPQDTHLSEVKQITFRSWQSVYLTVLCPSQCYLSRI